MASRPQRGGRRSTLTVALICILAIFSIWLVTYQRIVFERGQAVTAVMNSNSNLAIAFEQQAYRTLKAAEQVAAFVREQYLVQGTDIDLVEWVEQGSIRETMFTIVSVVNEAGDVVDSSHTTASVNYSDRDFFVAQRNSQRDELYVNIPVVGRVSGEARVPMSLRITRPDGSFAGVVVMSVDPDNFTDFYSRADLGGRGLLELTGLDGVVRARKIGQRSGHGQAAGELAWFHRQSADTSGSFIDDGSTLDGVARIVSYRSLEGYPFMVAVGTAYDDDMAPVLQRRADYLTIAGLASVVLAFFTVLLILLLDRRRKAAEALQASVALYRATFHQAATGIAHVAPDGRILRANQKFHDMLGYGDTELGGRMLAELSDANWRQPVQQFLERRLAADASDAQDESAEIEKPYRRKNGSLLWVCEALGVVRGADGKPDYLVAVTQDITARKELEARLSHDAMHDALTGLPNRSLFHDRLEHALASARRHGRQAAVLYLDLDGFKEINDIHGHAVGDVLLQEAARRMKQAIRDEDTVARLGGDEFAVVLGAVRGPSDSAQVADKLVQVLSQPYEFEGRVLRLSVSVGIARFPDHGEDARTLLLHADEAMYARKRAAQRTGAQS